MGYEDTGWEQILAGQFDTVAGADLVFYQPGLIIAGAYAPDSLIPITFPADAPDSQVLTVLNWSPHQ